MEGGGRPALQLRGQAVRGAARPQPEEGVIYGARYGCYSLIL